MLDIPICPKLQYICIPMYHNSDKLEILIYQNSAVCLNVICQKFPCDRNFDTSEILAFQNSKCISYFLIHQNSDVGTAIISMSERPVHWHANTLEILICQNSKRSKLQHLRIPMQYMGNSAKYEMKLMEIHYIFIKITLCYQKYVKLY